MKPGYIIVVKFLIIYVCVKGLAIEYDTATTAPKKITTRGDAFEECILDSRVDRNLIKTLKFAKWNLPKITTSVKYWAFCYLHKLDIMSESGVLRQDVVLKYIPKKDREVVVDIIDKCLFNDPHLPMETAWHYLYCFHKANSKLSKRIHGV